MEIGTAGHYSGSAIRPGLTGGPSDKKAIVGCALESSCAGQAYGRRRPRTHIAVIKPGRGEGRRLAEELKLELAGGPAVWVGEIPVMEVSTERPMLEARMEKVTSLK